MTRLIDADKINFKWINGVICVEPKDIEKMPTVDAVPVEWIESQVDKGKWAELVQRWKERKEE